MKSFWELPRPTILMRLAWHRGADRMTGKHPDEFKRGRKGNHAATSGAINARPSWRNTPERLIAIYTPKFRKGRS